VSLGPTSVPAKRDLNLSNGLSRGHEYDRQTDDRQSETDRAAEKCVGVGGIVYAATAIPPNNT